MFEWILLILLVICLFIIVGLVLKNKRKQEKEIEFNEFDDWEKIKQKKNDKQHIENELKELEKIRQEQEYHRMVKRQKELEENEKKEPYKRTPQMQSDEEILADNIIDSVLLINQTVSDTIDKIDKKIEDKEKRGKTKILDTFHPDNNNKIYEGSEIREISENNVNFNLDLFKKWCEGIFFSIEIAEPKELATIKTCILPDMYNKLIKNANELKKDGLKLQRDEIFIEEIKLIDYGKDISKEEIKILIKSQMKEYIMNIENKKVLRGNKEKIKEKNILMTFHKKRTDLETEGIISSCPNCGAPISQAEFGICKYCDTIVLPIRYNWTLVKFEAV